MKQVILEKLFNNEELTREEILFVSRELPGEASTIAAGAYDHSLKDPIQACQLSQADVKLISDGLNATMEKLQSEKGPGLKVSEAVEELEVSVTPMIEKALRLLLIDLVSRAVERSMIDRIVKGLGGQGPSEGGFPGGL